MPALLWAQTQLPNDEDSSSASKSTNACRIETVLPRVSSHTKEFVENVNRFTATEVLDRERLDHRGKLQEKARSRAHYVATIQEMQTGFFGVDEYRNEVRGAGSVDGTIEANVAPALALIFHPSHTEEFDMTCEGPTDWNGRSTWRIHFQQRLDRPATMSTLEVGKDFFTILLKGFAWIDCDNYQILHLETDLLEPMPKIRLATLHQTVDYAPVTFSHSDTTLWLPRKADVTAEFKGKRLVERHTYSEFRLFWVDTGQKIGKPFISSN